MCLYWLFPSKMVFNATISHKKGVPIDVTFKEDDFYLPRVRNIIQK